MFAKRNSEKGQALVLLLLAVVGLLGFSAVALDGGQIYSQRRRAQNVADNAVLASALKSIQGQDYEAEGLSIAQENNYTNDAVTNWVAVNQPPTAGTYAGNSEYVEVVITQSVPTNFAHLIYNGQVRLTVRAVARATAATSGPLALGQALVALNPTACKALWFTGTGEVTITGSGAFSNSDATPPPSSCGSGVQGGTGDISVTGGGIDVVGAWVTNGGAGSVSPTPTTGASPLSEIPSVDEDSLDTMCAGLPNYGDYIQNGGTAALDPGNYDGITLRANGNLTMNPGLYCLNGAFDTSGGEVTGVGVLIYLISGSFETNGNATNSLSAPTSSNCASGTPDLCDFTGLLIYMAEANTSPVDINGGSGTSFTGTFFAPAADCEINGSGDGIGLNSQVICDTVKVSGTADLNITYNGGDNFQQKKPAQIILAER